MNQKTSMTRQFSFFEGSKGQTVINTLKDVFCYGQSGCIILLRYNFLVVERAAVRQYYWTRHGW